MKVDSLKDVESEINSLKLDFEREKLARTSNRNLFIGIATALTALLGYTNFSHIPKQITKRIDEEIASSITMQMTREVASLKQQAEESYAEITNKVEQTDSVLSDIENVANFQSQIRTSLPLTSNGTPLKIKEGIANNWEVYKLGDEIQGQTIKIRVDTSDAGFQETPLYFTSVSGGENARLWQVTGTTSIYNPTKDGFELYIYKDDGITPANARKLGWQVHWLAIGE